MGFNSAFNGLNLYYISLFVNTVCRDETVMRGATDRLQQPQLCAL